MPVITPEILSEVRKTVYDFFAEECDVDRESITDGTNIITELEGDSLMLLSLLEVFRKRYRLTVELKTLGKHLMKRPASTVGQVIDLTLKVVEKGDDILNMAL